MFLKIILYDFDINFVKDGLLDSFFGGGGEVKSNLLAIKQSTNKYSFNILKINHQSVQYKIIFTYTSQNSK